MDFEIGMKIIHEDGEWAIITGVTDRVKVDGWHSKDGTKFEPTDHQQSGWPLSVAKHLVEVGSWTVETKNQPTPAWVAPYASKPAQTSHQDIPAAKKALSPSQPCAIHYFSSAEKRDKAYQIMASQFGFNFQHIERRSTDRAVVYPHWIVVGDTDAYKIEMQNFLRNAECVELEIQYVDYRTVLADSFSVGE